MFKKYICLLFYVFFWNQVSESRTLEELQTSTEPLTDYLANAGCLRPFTSLMDKSQLLEDVLMFQVVHRIRGPFERYVLS